MWRMVDFLLSKVIYFLKALIRGFFGRWPIIKKCLGSKKFVTQDINNKNNLYELFVGVRWCLVNNLNLNFTTGAINTWGRIFNIFSRGYDATLVSLILNIWKAWGGQESEGFFKPTAFKRDNFRLENFLMPPKPLPRASHFWIGLSIKFWGYLYCSARNILIF